MKKIFTSFFLCVLCFQIQATHIVGGVISYKHQTGMNYKVKLKLIRDCQGVLLGSTQSINVSSASLAQNFSLTVTLSSSGNLQSYCPTLATTCTSTSATLPGYEFDIYEDTLTLPAAATDWEFSYNTCCRNAGINNIQNPMSSGIYIHTTLNNLSSVGAFNNSVDFILDNLVMYGVNQNNNLNQAGIDIDGDSLHYSLVDAWSTSTVPVTYVTGFSATAPLGTTGTMTINPVSGSLSFINTLLGANVVAIKVDEYRGGNLIATTIQDMQFGFMNMGTNQLPALSGVNGTPNYYTALHVCPSSSLTFTINGSDPDLLDSVHVNLIGTDIVGSTLTGNGALQETATFNWTPSISDIRPQPYLLVLEANDNCHHVSFGYLIYIHQCNTDSVWAGDANADFVVDNYDVLNIGIGNGTTGIIRPGATTNWVAEYCPSWSNNFMSGINYKHADCNGDGTIDGSDMNAVTLNYGQFHLKTGNPGIYKTRGLPDLYFDVSGVQAIPGTTIQVPVMLGTTASPMNDVYGIAGHFSISNTLSAPISCNNSSSWLGNTGNSFFFQKNMSSNELAFTFVRHNHSNMTGFGQIGLLSIPIDPSAAINSDLFLNFTDLKLIQQDGTEIIDYNVINDTLKIAAPNSTSNIASLGSIELYPNPVRDNLTLKNNLNNTEIVSILITDLFGHVVFRKDVEFQAHESLHLNLSMLSKGCYSVKLISSTYSANHKMIMW